MELRRRSLRFNENAGPSCSRRFLRTAVARRGLAGLLGFARVSGNNLDSKWVFFKHNPAGQAFGVLFFLRRAGYFAAIDPWDWHFFLQRPPRTLWQAGFQRRQSTRQNFACDFSSREFVQIAMIQVFQSVNRPPNFRESSPSQCRIPNRRRPPLPPENYAVQRRDICAGGKTAQIGGLEWNVLRSAMVSREFQAYSALFP